MPQRSPEYETQYKNMSNLMADLRKVYCFCSCSSSWSTIIFQTVWHFASASRLNFSHDDFLSDSDWVFKINELAYQTESQPMHWPIVHRVRSVCISSRFYKHVDSKIAPKTRAIVNINMLFYMNNDFISHYTFKSNFFMHCLLYWSVYFFLLQNRARHTPNAIGHCIVYIVFDMLISLRLKIQSLSLLWSSCENFRPLAEAKCHTVWKMIVAKI